MATSQAQMPRIPMVSGGVARIEVNGPSKFLLGGCPIPVETAQNESQRRMSFAERVIQFQSLDRRGFRGGKSLPGGHDSVLPVSQQRVGVGQPAIRLCIVGGLRDRLVKILLGLVQTLGGSSVPEISTLEIRLVGVWIDGLDVFQCGLFLWLDVDPDLLGDGASHAALERERVTHITIVALGP